MNTSSAEQGFTLIEVLVALVLMAVVSLVSWRGLDSVIRIRDHVERDAQRDAAILRVMGQLERDVQMRAPDYVLQGAGAAPTKTGTLPAAIDVARNADAPLRFDVVRAMGTSGASWQRVRWWQESGMLRRASAAPGDSLPLPQPGPGATVLQSVSAFNVRAYIPGQGWASLPLGQAAQAATGLEFTIDVASGSGPAQRYRRVVALP